MAQRVQVLLTCDLCEGDVEAVQTVRLGNDGSWYELELCPEHLERYTDTVNGFVAAARPADGRRPAAARRPSAPAGRGDEVRRWAREHGFEISDRGRVPRHVAEAYAAANGSWHDATA